MVALWREAARAGGDLALVSGLLAAAAKALPTVVAGSIKNENGRTAGMLLRTILAVLSSQVGKCGSLYILIQGDVAWLVCADPPQGGLG